MQKIILKNINEYMNRRKALGPIQKSNYISSIIKNKRLVQNLTLQEATEKICSEAFLSKLERNLMDPRNERVELLCERFNLNYNELLKLENNNQIEVLLLNYFKTDFVLILSMNTCTCTDEYIAQDEIVKAYQYFINQDYKMVQSIVNNLDNIKECLNDLELFALILLVYEYNFISLQFSKADGYLNILEKFIINQKECNEYIMECRYMLSCKMALQKVPLLFNELRDKMLYYNYSKSTLFTLYYFEYLNDESVINYINNIDLTLLTAHVKEEIIYIKAKAYVKTNRFYDAFNVIRSEPNKSVRLVTLFALNLVNLMIYKKTNREPVNKLYVDTDEFKKLRLELIALIKNVKQTSIDTYHLAFLRLMQYEIDESEEEVIANYIKNYLLKELQEFTYPLYNNYIVDRYCSLLGKLCRYKDAFNFLLDWKKTFSKNCLK